MMVIFLVGLVSMILMRTLRKDYARYSKDEDVDYIIPVTLKSIQISCQLINYLAEVTVEQEYQNVEEGPIECK